MRTAPAMVLVILNEQLGVVIPLPNCIDMNLLTRFN